MDRNEFTSKLKAEKRLTITDANGNIDLYVAAEIQSEDGSFTVSPVYRISADHCQWFEEDAKFMGFIMNDTLYQADYSLKKSVFKDHHPKGTTLTEINAALRLAVIECLRNRIPDMEHMKRYAADKMAEIETDSNMTEALKNCHDKIERAFYQGVSSKSLLPYIGPLEGENYFFPAEDLLHYIHSPEAWIQTLTDAYIKKHASTLYISYRCNEVRVSLLKEIENNPAHPYNLIRNISNSIENQVTVYLDIQKNSIPYTVKVKANDVKNLWRLKQLSARSICITTQKKEFSQMYGYSESINPEDIVRIRHGNRILFEKA